MRAETQRFWGITTGLQSPCLFRQRARAVGCLMNIHAGAEAAGGSVFAGRMGRMHLAAAPREPLEGVNRGGPLKVTVSPQSSTIVKCAGQNEAVNS